MMIDLRIDRHGGRDVSPTIPSGAGDLEIIHSCNDTWLIDHDRRRFRRIPSHAPVSFLAEVGQWQTFERIEIEPETDNFILVLTPSGSSRLRSFRHHLPCELCHEGVPATVGPEAASR